MTSSSRSVVTRSVNHVLAQLTVRLRWMAALRGAALGVALHALWLLVLWCVSIVQPDALAAWPEWLRASSALQVATQALAAAGVVSLLASSLAWRRQRLPDGTEHCVAELERAVPESRNLLRTAWELEQSAAMGPSDRHRREDPAVAQLVQERAAQLLGRVALSERWPLEPLRRRVWIAACLWLPAALLYTLAGHDSVLSRTALRTAARGLQRIVNPGGIAQYTLRVTPPAYTGQTATTLQRPEQLRAIEGSVLELQVESSADSLLVHTDSGAVPLTRAANGRFVWRGRVLRDGFLAVATAEVPSATSGETAQGTARRRDQVLIAIVSQPDARPSVRIREPGRDLLVDSSQRSVRIAVEASDDLALRTLTLAYTKVAGAGERFTFSEGELPLQLSRESATAWKASASLALSSLLQDPGDLVVYRARATDTRPGAEPVESDAFIVERQPDGGMAAAGFALDPDEDRYAVSQQMVILKTERLIAARASMPAERVATEARALAGEQRRVRAEFVFMTGGEFEQALVATEEGMDDLDETHEAESEGDLSAGRMANRGRAALLTAIRAMSRAALALGESDLTNALRLERVALTNLQEAFARQRFLMRALSQREQLDESRRLTGTLDSVSRRPREPVRSTPAVLQRGLAGILSALADSSESPGRLAIRVLQLAPGGSEARELSRWLQQAESRSAPAARRAARDSASLKLSAWLNRIAAPDGGLPRSASAPGAHE